MKDMNIVANECNAKCVQRAKDAAQLAEKKRTLRYLEVERLE